MSARTLVGALGQRRRSALEIRLTTSSPRNSSSVASQLLARCRRASLEDDAQTQHDVLAQLTKPSSSETRGDDASDCSGEQASGKCSHRSSISTVVEEEETGAAAVAALQTKEIGDHDDLAAEAEDCLMPLPTITTSTKSRCGSSTNYRRATTSAPSTLVPRRRKFNTVLREHAHQELYLFREEAEYSDYVDARVTGVHTEMDSVVYYAVDVQLSQVKWQVLRRFSEFRRLRQRLLKHLARRQRFQSLGQCRICANILQTMEQAPFPSRTQRTPWSSSARSVEVIADRKQKLQAFVTTCLLTVRGLRQHSRLMRDSSSCEISVALRMIEEFLGLSFTRFMRFLNERGVLATNDDDTHDSTAKTAKGKLIHQTHTSTSQALLPSATRSDGARRAMIAV